MKTVVSKTGVEVLYPCAVHLLNNGEVVECEYKSDNTGQDLMDYICEHLNMQDRDYWGLRFVDTYEQRHWLDLSKLIRPQLRTVCPIQFHFRVKVYPPEPYKLVESETRFQIFMQLKFDLQSGRLCCTPSDSALLLALILQHNYGDYDDKVHVGNYVQDKMLINQSFLIESKALELHKNHLVGLSKSQIEDLFLRMAGELETYGVDPYLVEDADQQKLTLWINYQGILTYVDTNKIHHLDWMSITKIQQDGNQLLVHLFTGNIVNFTCLTKAECNYIYQGAVDHLVFFTASGSKSTTGIIGSESAELILAEEEAIYHDINEKPDDFDLDDAMFDKLLEENYAKHDKISVIGGFWGHHILWYIFFLIIFTVIIVKLYFIFQNDIIFGYYLLKKHGKILIKKHLK